ncbi:MAG: hypothetical protein M0C28_13395 [Candidatus Moduliflexus flocculans]|nr:hypothetical protein [Candidatus Moduliflexus flocculans]
MRRPPVAGQEPAAAPCTTRAEGSSVAHRRGQGRRDEVRPAAGATCPRSRAPPAARASVPRCEDALAARPMTRTVAGDGPARRRAAPLRARAGSSSRHRRRSTS